MKLNKKQIYKLSIWGIISFLVLGIIISANVFASSYHPYLTNYYGTIGSHYENIGDVLQYQADYNSKEETLAAFSELNAEITEEGTVLIKNDNSALPLKKGSAISVFGMTSILWMTQENIPSTKDSVFADKLEDAGYDMNTSLRAMYKTSSHTNWGQGDNKGDGSASGSWAIDEVPQSEYTQTVKDSYASYGDAAIVVFSRSSGEGADLPRNMDRFGGSEDEHYLQLNSDEKDLLQAIEDANCFEKTIVILHSANPMQMDFINNYDIDSVLWVSGTGTNGIDGLIKVITGEVSPSGKLVDTYTYDNFSAPAMQNFGDFRYTTSNGTLLKDTSLGFDSYSYLNYAEGIYVGYRYYETRYEDKIIGAENVGNYDYSDVVAAPFGHGLSYGEFEWRNFNYTYDQETDTFELTAVVENKGDFPAKEVVQFYLQKPYDKNSGIETSAVELCGFGKTDVLEKNKSQRITVTIPGSVLKSYDSKNSNTYILDEGDYYFTAAKNSHEAVNNILSAKGYSTSDGMDANGNPEMTKEFIVNTKDVDKYSKTVENGTIVTNQFDDALLEGAIYLSRSNWSVLDSWTRDWTSEFSGGITYSTGILTGLTNTTDSLGTVKTAVVNPKDQEILTEKDAWKLSGNPNAIDSYDTIVTESDNDLELVQTVGLDYNDQTWGFLLDMLSIDEMHKMYRQGSYSSIAIDKINKPSSKEADGPGGVGNYSYGPAQIMIASTWNNVISAKYGNINGNYALLNEQVINGWYAPGMNIHRTQFSGRNFEYSSEDPYLSGSITSSMIYAAQEKGLNVVMKHFALNDQETNRAANGYVATYATEQAIRELYLKPFEMGVIEGGAMGVMASMGRIGNVYAPANYNLNVNVLKNEMGFKGLIITDYVVVNPYYSLACIAGGTTLQLSSAPNSLSDEALATTGVQYMLREATHGTLYFVANSNRLNGFVPGTSYVEGFPIYIIYMGLIDIIVISILSFGIVLQLNNIRTINNSIIDEMILKRNKNLNIIYWSVTGLIIITAIVIFIFYALPLLRYAFNIS